MENKALKELQGTQNTQDSVSVKDAYFDVLESVKRDLNENARQEMLMQQLQPLPRQPPSNTQAQTHFATPSSAQTHFAIHQQTSVEHVLPQFTPVDSNDSWRQAQLIDDDPYSRQSEDETFVNNTRRRKRNEQSFDINKVIDMTSDFKIGGKMVPASSLQLNSIFMGKRMLHYAWCKKKGCGQECRFAHRKM